MMRRALALAAAVLLGMTGCSFLTPGLDTRTAAVAKNKVVWDQESNLWMDDDTTQNTKTFVGEGFEGSMQLDFYPDGSVKSVKGANHVLNRWNEPKDVMAGYMRLAEMNAQVASQIMETIRAIAPGVIARNQSPPASTDADNLPLILQNLNPEELAQIIAALRAAGVTVPSQGSP